MSEKRPLVLYSGGLDSTYLIYRLVEANMPFDVLYVEGGQCQNKVREEDKVREAFLYTYLRDTFPDYRHHINKFQVKLDWFNSLRGYQTDKPSLSQPQTWIFAAHRAFDPGRHSEVQVGYLLGETEHNPHLKKVWDGLCQLLHCQTYPLTFPLQRHYKSMVLDDIPKELFNYVWVCELPMVDVTGVPSSTYRCGRCRPCQTLGYAFMELSERRFGEDFRNKLAMWNSQLDPRRKPRFVLEEPSKNRLVPVPELPLLQEKDPYVDLVHYRD